MKTSNKIIALIFGLLILIPALVVATILFKYRSGDFTRLDMKSGMITKTFPAVKSITLRDLGNLYIIPSDSLYAETTIAENSAPIRFNTQGVALLIYADSVWRKDDNAGTAKKNSEQVYSRRPSSLWLYLPANYSVSIENCGVVLSTKSRVAEQEGFTLQLVNSALNDNLDDSSHVRFRKLTLTGDNSIIQFSGNLQAAAMELNLKNNSRLDIGRSHIGNLVLNVDSTTALHLNGQQLKSVIQK